MNKKERQIVFNKYGGRCAYCGCNLGGRWHCDHMEPVNRKNKRIGNCYVHKETGEPFTDKDLIDKGMPVDFYENYKYVPSRVVPDGFHNPENDTLENRHPACSSCNIYKSSMSLESFRKQIGLLVERLNKSFTQYKIAKRYGLVEEIQKPVVFYFETLMPNETQSKIKKTGSEILSLPD